LAIFVFYLLGLEQPANVKTNHENKHLKARSCVPKVFFLLEPFFVDFTIQMKPGEVRRINQYTYTSSGIPES